MPIAIALLLLSAFAWFGAGELPQLQVRREQALADVAATSLLAYREAVLDHLNAEPGFTGTAPEAALTLPWGQAADPRWAHVLPPGGTLYVYARAGSSTPPLLLDALQRKTLQSFLVGRQTGGVLVSAGGWDTGLPVPAAVPEGAVVLAGR